MSLFCKFVVCRADERERIAPQMFAVQLWIRDGRQRDDGEFGSAVADEFVRGFGVDELDVQFDVGEALRKCFQHRCQPVQSDVVARGHREAAVDPAVEVAQHHFRVGEFAEQFERPRLEQRARLREVDPFADAVEQRYADAGFQRLDSFGDRGLGQVQLFGGAGKRSGLGDGDECLQFIPFHN